MQILNTLLNKQYITPEGIPLVNELMNLLIVENGVSRDWSNVETYKRKRNGGLRQTQ